MSAYIMSAQASLFGQPDVIGFGSPEFYVREMPRDKANAIIQANHYSRKFYSATYIHLGVYIGGNFRGVLQFGYAMNPASAGSVVTDTAMDEYLELNRMWLDDIAPHCSESRALSHAFKFIKRKYPKVKWCQSFADERCGKFGAVYQASGFRYYGEHMGLFWEFDGEFFHDSILTDSRKAQTPKGRKVHENRDKLVRHDLRQFRYIYFFAPRFAKGVRLKEQPFPKPNAACPLDEPVPTGASGVRLPEAAPISQVAA